MPADIPGLALNGDGVCGYCEAFEEAKPMGKEKLDAIADAVRCERKRWECLVPLSGGRESTYALYYASRILKLRVLAVTFDNEFLTPAAEKNMMTACRRLGVSLKRAGSKKGLFKKIVRETIRCAPSVKQLSVCRACDIGIKSVVYKTALDHRVPLILWGESQYERTGDMTPRALNAVKGLSSRYWKLLSPGFYMGELYMLLFRRELHVPGNGLFRRGAPVLRDPFIREIQLYDYISWDRGEIKAVISRELGWEKPEGAVTSWKIDCALYPLVNYEFFRLFGCSKDCFGYNRMINSGRMTREEALAQETRLMAHYKDGLSNLLQKTIGLPETVTRRVLSEAFATGKRYPQ